MSLNANVHFSRVPAVSMRRSVFKEPFEHLTSLDFGKLVPFYLQECIPGGTYVRKDEKVYVQMSTPATCVFDESYFDVFYFFVPYRLVWDHSEHFFARTKENDYVPETEYTVPGVEPYGVEMNSVFDYMGVCPGVSKVGATTEYVSALYPRGYALVWNTYFRSEELQDPILIDKSDSNHAYVSTNDGYFDGAQYGGECCPVDKYHDYFTSALLRPLRNAEGVPLISELAPVISSDDGTDDAGHSPSPVTFNTVSGSAYTPSNNVVLGVQGATGFLRETTAGTLLYPSNLYAKIEADVSQFRQAIALQRMFEKDNLYGGRYTSVLYGHYSVQAPDARLQRPEFIGGLRFNLNVQQVLQQSETASTPLGYRGAYSVTVKHDKSVFNYTALEHGFILGVCAARTKNKYQYGIERFLSRKKRTDFYWPVLSGLGEMAIKNKEIYFSGTYSKDNEVFGYQEYASDYKYKPDRISGIFRSNATGTLDFYHYAEIYNQTPVLNDDWIKQDSQNVARTLLVDGAFANQLIVQFKNVTNCILPMPVYNVPAGLTHMF